MSWGRKKKTRKGKIVALRGTPTDRGPQRTKRARRNRVVTKAEKRGDCVIGKK